MTLITGIACESRLSFSVFDFQESLERLYLTWVYWNLWDHSFIELMEGIKLFMKFIHTHNFIFYIFAVSQEIHITARIISPLVEFDFSEIYIISANFRLQYISKSEMNYCSRRENSVEFA